MPETNKREYTSQSKKQAKTLQGKGGTSGGQKFPNEPSGSDGNYEHTAAGKTKLKGI